MLLATVTGFLALASTVFALVCTVIYLMVYWRFAERAVLQVLLGEPKTKIEIELRLRKPLSRKSKVPYGLGIILWNLARKELISSYKSSDTSWRRVDFFRLTARGAVAAAQE